MPVGGTLLRQLCVIAREPLVHFLALGLVAWVAVDRWRAHDQRYTIVLDHAQRQIVSDDYVRQFGKPPSAEQLQRLTERHVREEIYRREALALGLDQEDEIVRRRLVQKFEFLQTDLAVPAAPAEGDLKRWFERHSQRYRMPPRVSFSHVYFSPDQGGQQEARQRAVRALSALQSRRALSANSIGDAFPGPMELAELAQPEAQKLFGESEFANRLFAALPAGWAGPWRSGYGWHLVQIHEQLPEHPLPFEQVRSQVLADYLEEQRRLLNAAQFSELRARYTVRAAAEVR